MTKIELVKGVAYELDPEKKYIFIFDAAMVSREDLQNLGEALTELKIKGVSLNLKGDPSTVKIIETK